MNFTPSMKREISCRITRTLILYVRETNGSLGTLLDGLDLDEEYLMDTNNWVSHAFLHILYARMIEILGDKNAVYKMNLAGQRYQPLGVLDRIARLLGNPKLIFSQGTKYNKLLKANGDVVIHDSGDSWVLLEDRYHDSSQKTRLDCDYNRGMLAAIPTIFGMPPAKVEEIKCQVPRERYGERIWPDEPEYGATGCLYRVQWEPKRRPALWKQLFQQYNVYRQAIEDLQEANRVIGEKYDEARNLAIELEKTNRQLVESKRQLETYTAELKESEQRYRLLAENMTDTIWTMSLEPLRFTYVSPSVQRMRGYSAEEAMKLTLEETLTPESLQEVSTLLAEKLRKEAEGAENQEEYTTLEVQQICKDRSTVWAEVVASFIRDQKGKPVGLLGVSRNISERKRAEQLYQAKIAAEASSAAKSEFLSNMSHELRTPLNHILGFTELVLGKNFGELNPVQEEYLTDVHQSSRHLLSLVNEILDVSKIEAGKLELRSAKIHLRQLLERSLSIIVENAAKRKIRLSAEVSAIPETVMADELRLKQILYNLLSNAVKFTEEGGSISLRARVIRPEGDGRSGGHEGPGEFVEVSVVDTGIGIHERDKEKIFEPFSQLENSMSRKYPGTGLGLALARHLVEMHGGRIWVESAGPGKGSAFRFTLPLREKENIEV